MRMTAGDSQPIGETLNSVNRKRNSSGAAEMPSGVSSGQRSAEGYRNAPSGLMRDLGSGSPLDSETLGFFEPRFGCPLGDVRIHTGREAAHAANTVDAFAFTAGKDIVFGEGQYRPDTEGGRKLLAHELSHSLQGWSAPAGGQEIRRQERPDADWTDVVTNGRREAFRDRAGAVSRSRVMERQNPGKEFRVVSSGRTFVIQSRTRVAPAEEAPIQTAPAGAGTSGDAGTAPDAGTSRDAGAADARTTSDAGTHDAGTPPTPPPPVFALTFDDGPHSAGLGTGNNRTENVLNTLDAKGLKGKAAFFIQTAAQDAQGHAIRGSSPNGLQLVQRMDTDGYAIGIHTGGTRDHESHVATFNAGRLQSELTSAESYVHGITGSDPDFVRAPFGNIGPAGSATRQGIEATYATLGLTHLLWDIDGDYLGESMTLPQLVTEFDSQFRALRRNSSGAIIPTTPSQKVVVLYHDIRRGTSANIGGVIDHIRAAVPGATFEKP